MPLPLAPSPSMSLRLSPRGTGPSSHATASTPLPWRDQPVVSSRCGRTSFRSTRRVQCTLWSEVRIGILGYKSTKGVNLSFFLSFFTSPSTIYINCVPQSPTGSRYFIGIIFVHTSHSSVQRW